MAGQRIQVVEMAEHQSERGHQEYLEGRLEAVQKAALAKQEEMMEQFGADNIVEFYDVCTDTDIAELQEEERRAREAEKHRKRLNGGAFKRMGQQILGEIHDKHELFDDFSDSFDDKLAALGYQAG